MKFLKNSLLFLLTVSTLLSDEVQKVIIYRSRLEMENEQYMYDHPEQALYVLYVMVAAAVIMIGYKIWKNKKGR